MSNGRRAGSPGSKPYSPLAVSPDATERDGPSRVTAGSLADRLTRVWQEVLELPHIGMRDRFYDLGGDSLALVELGNRLRKEFAVSPPLEELASGLTVEGLAGWILERGEETPPPGSDLIVRLRQEATSAPANEPLVLVHPSGGSVLCYLDLVERLAPGRDVLGVQGPPLGSGRSFPESVEAMAREYLDALAPELEPMPPILAGYSFGGVVAYEMARQLEAGSRPAPRLVVLFDSKAPFGPETGFEPGLMGELGRVLEGHEIEDEPGDLEQEKALWDDLADLAERGLEPIFERNPGGRPKRRRRMGAIQHFFLSYRLFPAGEEFDYLRVRRFLRSLQANLRCARDYRGGPYGGDVVLFQAGQRLGAAEISARQHRDRWARSIHGDLRVVELPTHHLDLFSSPALGWVVSALGDVLAARAPGRSRPPAGRA